MTRFQGRYVTADFPPEGQPGPSWASGCVLLVVVFAVGVAVGLMLCLAAVGQRPQPSTTPRPEATAGSTIAYVRPASVLGPAASPAPTSASAAAVAVHPALAQRAHAVRIAPERLERVVTGIASHMGYTEPAGYLALPEGRSRRVIICGAGGCIRRTSTDAGPDRAMQRAGRVADLNRFDFVTVCGRPLSAGICDVTVRYLA